MALPKLKAAACHIAPSVFSARNSTQKVIDCIKLAGKYDANLVVFPESAIPAFPIWSSLLPPTQTHHFFQHMTQESLLADGEEINEVRLAAKNAHVIVSLGFSEKAPFSTGCLFNSNIIIGESGDVLVHHRKLQATFWEKLTWSAGDGYGLRVAETKYGNIGGLICGENTNPLARYVLMAQGEQVHISTWPAIWPTRSMKAEKTGGVREERNYDNIAANRMRAAAHCFEAKCFG
jgi:nitrilase